jgi:cardiolipin synthase
MNLHRTTGQPDWAGLNEDQVNPWQRLAARTKGIVTPPNIVTIVGLIIVITGLYATRYHHYWTGVIALLIGRLLDLVDGWLAQLTGTKSPLGELLDATVDKVGTFLTLGVLFVTGLAPRWLLLAILLPHLIISLIVLMARLDNRSLHPSRLGKISMAIAWVALFGFVAAAALPHAVTTIITPLVELTGSVSVITGLMAAYGYARERS